MAAYMSRLHQRSVFRKLLFTNHARAVSITPRKENDNEQPTDGKQEGQSKVDLLDETNKVELTGFAKAFAKQVQAMKDRSNVEDDTTGTGTSSFATLLKNSSHVHLGNAHGQIVVGRIFHIVGDDLYIDFGGKFHCVCRRPEDNSSEYQRGTKVRLRLKDLELTDHFIGATRDISLLEADADLLGLHKI